MNKICTSIEQSKKLIELGIDVNTADMDYIPFANDPKNYDCVINLWNNEHEDDWIPVWSLSALLNILPKRCNNDTVYMPLVGRYYEGNKFICGYFGDGLLDWTFGETPVDACVAMIEKLNELKRL